MFLKWFFRLIKTLNSYESPLQVGFGIAYGFCLALIPANNLLWPIFFIISFFLKLNQAAMGVFLIVFKLIAPIFDGLLDKIGYLILTNKNLYGFFTTLYNTPFIPFTKFNNTIVFGALVSSLVLLPLLTILFTNLLILYRSFLKDIVENSKFIQWLKKLPIISSIIKLYESVEDFRNA